MDTYARILIGRIRSLEQELKLRPTQAQTDDIIAYGKHQHALYEAVLARNVILKRQVDEHSKKAS